jgi:hypothetical protein
MDHIKINDISSLFVTHDDKEIYLWYRSEELYEVGTDGLSDEMIEQLESVFEISGFPEYIPISYAVINYLNGHSLISIHDQMDILVMVHESSPFGKGHESNWDSGFICLFSLKFVDQEIHRVEINFKLVADRIRLSNGHKMYPSVISNDVYETDPDKDECSICLSTADPMIETECHHKFHLNCLRCTPHLVCPICRTDVKSFLNNNGITDHEMAQRLMDQQLDADFNDHCSMISMLDLDDILFPDMLRLCHESLRLNGGNVESYMNLVMDMNANASKLFNQISRINSKSESGVFLYAYESVNDFITQMLTQNKKSIVTWQPLSTFEESCLYDGVVNRLSKIENPSSEYLVVVVIENIADGQIVHKNDYKDSRFKRKAFNDIMHSLLYCTNCTCSSPSKHEPNREFTWAKKALRKLKKHKKKHSKISVVE